jgi:predicted TIM-barrel fold metal-dependent hydrolase
LALEFTGSLRYPSPREDWLSQVREEPLLPELPIIDAHHHIWEQDGNVYALSDLAGDTRDGHRVVGTVLVEAHAFYHEVGPEYLRPVGETEAIMHALEDAPELVAQGLCGAIVGRADLTLGARLEDVVEAHRAAAPDRFRGVRHLVGRDPHYPQGITIRPAPEGLLKRTDYRDGLRMLQRLGLSYDAMLYHSQLSDLVETVALVPELPVILNHYGMPLGVGPYADRRDEVFATWTSNMRRLAELPNVTVKLGGLGMVLTGAQWHDRPMPPSSQELADAWRPWFETCLEAFGPDRCMFESNFPVDKGMYSYSTVWNAFKRLAEDLGAAERAALFHDTAARVYRLPPKEDRL